MMLLQRDLALSRREADDDIYDISPILLLRDYYCCKHVRLFGHMSAAPHSAMVIWRWFHTRHFTDSITSLFGFQ